jgi:hypothetical protein
MNEIVTQLAECEEMVARIYAAYARRFPDLADLWSDLSRDELEHGRLVRFLADGIASGTASFNASDIRPQSIQMFYSYLHGQAVRAEAEHMAPVTALSIALSIEKSILEADYFRHFKGASLMAASAIRQLQEDTRRHQDELQKKWEEHRRYS